MNSAPGWPVFENLSLTGDIIGAVMGGFLFLTLISAALFFEFHLVRAERLIGVIQFPAR